MTRMYEVLSLLAFCFIVGARSAADEQWWDYLKDLPPVAEDDLIQNSDYRVVGGNSAKVGEFPFVVGLWRKSESRPFCGGSLISSR